MRESKDLILKNKSNNGYEENYLNGQYSSDTILLKSISEKSNISVVWYNKKTLRNNYVIAALSAFNQFYRQLNKDFFTEFENDKLIPNQAGIVNSLNAHQDKQVLMIALLVIVLSLLSLIILVYAYRQRTKSNKILKNISRMRTNFFTNITHEFRTPLTVILGLSEQLQIQKDLTRDETNYYLKAIDRQGNHLLRLVNQLLKMAKINAGMEKPEWKRGNIVLYIKLLIDSIQLYSAGKNVKINLKSSHQIIEMDFVPYYMDDIMHNLLSNAIKFSPENGEIDLSVTVLNNKKIEIRVSDKGPGISKNELEHIFELFYQGSNADKNNDSGVGLSYTLQLIEIMRGTISAESEENRGSVFIVTLPQQQFENWNLPAWNFTEIDPKSKKEKIIPDNSNSLSTVSFHSTAEIKSDKSITILLIEDNEDVQLYLKTLIPNHYRIITAQNGMTGMKLAYELLPDIVISDIMMPHKDGFSICEEIRKSELLNHIPIILLTARTSVDDQIKATSLGADAYIRKPFHPNELLVQIDSLLENRRILKEKYMRALIKPESIQ